jgi:hypothetical protein
MTRKLKYHQFFKLRPKSKLRPRFNRRTGSAFTPKETIKYEKEFADLYKGPLFSDGLLSVKLRFTIEGTELLIERVKPNDDVATSTTMPRLSSMRSMVWPMLMTSKSFVST